MMCKIQGYIDKSAGESENKNGRKGIFNVNTCGLGPVTLELVQKQAIANTTSSQQCCFAHNAHALYFPYGYKFSRG